jgi:hypothetical protein
VTWFAPGCAPRLALTFACPQVSSSAAAALSSVATYCGYGGCLRTLVSLNSDYIIDALCRQLRHLEVCLHDS